MGASGRLCRRVAWTAAIAIPLFAWSDLAHADDGVARFERGVQLYEADNFEGALVEFNAAYKLTKNYKLLYNIGICQSASKDYVGAVETFRHYLAEGGTEVTDARRLDVNERLQKLSLMVTRVRVTTDAPAGATLLVDDQAVGTTPLSDSPAVKVGRRQFSIVSSGRTVTKTLDIASGDPNASVSLLLGAEPKSPTLPTSPEPAPGSEQTTTAGPTFPWAFWGLTAVLGGGATVTGILAVGARNDLEERQATYGVRRSELESEHDKAKTLGLVTDGLLIGTAISAGVSTYLTIRYFAKKKRESALTVLPMGIGYTRTF